MNDDHIQESEFKEGFYTPIDTEEEQTKTEIFIEEDEEETDLSYPDIIQCYMCYENMELISGMYVCLNCGMREEPRQAIPLRVRMQTEKG